MSNATADSSFDLLPVRLPPGVAPPPPEPLPVVDLSSDGPLPIDLAEVQSREPQPLGETRFVPAHAADSSSVWLNGDVLMCACPDCRAPIPIRFWLMVADCWHCDTTIELTEEQEQAARRMMGQTPAVRGPAATPAPVARQPSEAPSSATTAPVARKPADAAAAKTQTAAPSVTPSYVRRRDARAATQPQPHRRSAAELPIGVRAKISRLSSGGGVRVWLTETLRDLPAWLVSLVFHLVLLLLLSLLTIKRDKPQRYITLSTNVQLERKTGENLSAKISNEPVDLPLPKNVKIDDAQQKQVIAEADQAARELRLSPDSPDRQRLPSLDSVKRSLSSAHSPRRVLAARDPRMRVEMIKREGGTLLTEAAVARGLRWLASQQQADGSWYLERQRSKAAGTALALLPFLGAGQTHMVGQYKDQVHKGLRWLVENQLENGDLRGGKGKFPGMYAHGQAAIVLCEAYAMTGDEWLRRPAQKAIDFIVEAQYPDGGWRYHPPTEIGPLERRGDTSVVGWQLMALHSARMANLDIGATDPEKGAAVLRRAGHFLDRARTQVELTFQGDDAPSNVSLYRYQPGRNAGTPAMTAEALLCRIYLGMDRTDPELQRGADYLTRRYTQGDRYRNRDSRSHLPGDDGINMYYWYYATQTLHHYGGPAWTRWNARMSEKLVSMQERSGKHAGSWKPQGGHSSAGGRIYMTSLAICSLEVYYRHVPIFKRFNLE